jgi:hypothetical protein
VATPFAISTRGALKVAVARVALGTAADRVLKCD